MLRPIENFGVLEFGNLLAEDDVEAWPDYNLVDGFDDDEPITREIEIVTQPRPRLLSKSQWFHAAPPYGRWFDANRFGSIMVYAPDVRMAIWNANRYALFWNEVKYEERDFYF